MLATAGITQELIIPRVLIIGYGPAGSQLTAQLVKLKKFDITVITPFDFQEVSLRMTGAVVSPQATHESAIYDLVREPGVNYVIGRCTRLTNEAATVNDNQAVEFDVCVVCCGQNVPTFLPNPVADSSRAARLSNFAAVGASIRAAKA